MLHKYSRPAHGQLRKKGREFAEAVKGFREPTRRRRSAAGSGLSKEKTAKKSYLVARQSGPDTPSGGKGAVLRNAKTGVGPKISECICRKNIEGAGRRRQITTKLAKTIQKVKAKIWPTAREGGGWWPISCWGGGRKELTEGS